MHTQRLFISILAIFIKLESAHVVPEDSTLEKHCDFRRTGCISAPDGAIQETANLIKFKESMFACLSTQQKQAQAPTFEVRKFSELSRINGWPNELVYCQCNLGACSANAIAFCLRYLSIRNSKNPGDFLTNPERIDPSRLYIYYNARFLEGAIKDKNCTYEIAHG